MHRHHDLEFAAREWTRREVRQFFERPQFADHGLEEHFHEKRRQTA